MVDVCAGVFYNVSQREQEGRKVNDNPHKYVCPKCGYMETSENAPMCPKCSWDFMGMGRVGVAMKTIDDEND